MNLAEILKNADWQKGAGLLPAIIQHQLTGQVLMLGYVNEESLSKTFASGKVWFYSRSKKRLWMKGEESGNILKFSQAELDCDADTLLIKALPQGPTCHTGATSCFGENSAPEISFLPQLFELLQERKKKLPENSYTSKLFQEGLDRIAQKVGEEAVEVVIAAKNSETGKFVGESADLLFHFLVLLAEKGIALQEIIAELQKRHSKD